MKLLAVLAGFMLLLGFGFVIVKAVQEPISTHGEKTTVLYWPKEDVREVCHGRDSCTDGGGKFEFYSISEVKGL